MLKTGACLPDFTDDILQSAPLEQAYTIPSSWYTDPAFHAWDRETIFSKTWQYVGHAAQVKNPGEYLVANVADNPVLVVRGENGELRGFFNVCRHRGGPLATRDGCDSRLRCGYHGWTYGLDGSLKGTPEFEGVKDFDPNAYGLRSIRVTMWQGLVFVNLDPDAVAFETVYAGIAERIAPIDLTALTYYDRVSYDLNCNWKVYMDNFLEGYHINYVHPELVDVLDYRNYVTELFPYYSLQYSPLKPSETMYGNGSQEIFYYCVFPNFMLNIMPNRLQLNTIIPLAQDRTRVVFDYFFHDITSEKARAMIATDLEASELIQQQDIDICERVQEGLASQAYDRGRFSVKRESGVHHFQDTLKAFYRAGMEERPPRANEAAQMCSAR